MIDLQGPNPKLTLAARCQDEHALIACCFEQIDIVDRIEPWILEDPRAIAAYEWLKAHRRDVVPGLAERLHSLSKTQFGLYAVVETEWMPLCHSPANWPYWEESCREKAIARRAAVVGDGLRRGEIAPVEATESLRKIALDGISKCGSSISQIMVEALTDMAARYDSQVPYSGLSTGFPGIDPMTDGMTAKALWVVAARPGVGKTTLGCNVLVQTAVIARAPTVFFSLEMSGKLIGQKLMHLVGRVSQTDRKFSRLPQVGFDKLNEALTRITESPVFLVDHCSTIQSIAAEVRRLKAEKGLRVAIVDYLQRVRVGDSKDDRWADIGTVSNALKDLAMECDVTVFALAQLSRSVEKDGRRPQLSDLRGSAEIEADADVVGFLWEDNNRLTLTIEKSRVGTTGSVLIAPNMDTGVMEEDRQLPTTQEITAEPDDPPPRRSNKRPAPPRSHGPD